MKIVPFLLAIAHIYVIDVVIPCVHKDLYTLDTCISYAKKNI